MTQVKEGVVCNQMFFGYFLNSAFVTLCVQFSFVIVTFGAISF